MQKSTQRRRPTQASSGNLKPWQIRPYRDRARAAARARGRPRPPTWIAKRPTAFPCRIQRGFPSRVAPGRPAFDRISRTTELQHLALIGRKQIAAGGASFLAIGSIFGARTMHALHDRLDVRALDDLFEIAGGKVGLRAHQLRAVGHHGADRIGDRERRRRVYRRSKRLLERTAEDHRQQRPGNHHPTATTQTLSASHRAPRTSFRADVPGLSHPRLAPISGYSLLHRESLAPANPNGSPPRAPIRSRFRAG